MIQLRNIKRTIKRAILEPAYAWNAGTKRLRGWLAYKFSDGNSPWPESITLFLTRRCNLRCKMCGQWGESGSFKNDEAGVIKNELTQDEIKVFLDDINTFKPNMTLFGGEPLLHREIEFIIREIKKRGLHLLIITNGFLLTKYARLIVDYEVDELSVSIDGPPETNDSIRGMPGLSEHVNNGIKTIREIQKQLNKKYPVINVVCTISKHNAGKLAQMIDTASKLDIDTLNLHHLIWIDRKLNKEHQNQVHELLSQSSPDWNGFVFERLNEDEINELVKSAEDINANRWHLPVYFYPNLTPHEIRLYYSESHFMPKTFAPRCIHPWMASYIYPDGSVWPCHTLGYSAGNVRQDKFTNIWNNEKYKNYRKLMKKSLWPVCTKCTEFYRY